MTVVGVGKFAIEPGHAACGAKTLKLKVVEGEDLVTVVRFMSCEKCFPVAPECDPNFPCSSLCGALNSTGQQCVARCCKDCLFKDNLSEAEHRCSYHSKMG